MKRIIILSALILAVITSTGSPSINISTSGSGDHVIIIAGLGGEEPWAETLAGLSKTNTCHFITINGIDGQHAAGMFNSEDIVDEIARFVKDKNIVKPIISGHSIGGFLALRFAAKHLGVARKLVIIDAYPFGPALIDTSFTSQMGRQQSDFIRRQLMAMPDEAWAGLWMHNLQQMVADPIKRTAIHQNVMESQRSSVVDAQCEILGNDLRPLLFYIDCPVLVLCSASDFFKTGMDPESIEKHVHAQFSQLPSYSIFIHDSSGHFIMCDDNFWMLKKINQFIL